MKQIKQGQKHNTKVTSVVKITLLSLISIGLIGCPFQNKSTYSYAKKDDGSFKILTAMYNDILKEIDYAYTSGNWEIHSNKTYKAINFISLYPSYDLIKISEPLNLRIKNGNILPYISIISEYSFRL